MAGSPILTPSPSHPDYLIASRLAQLEQRVARLETSRGTEFEVVTFTEASPSYVFTWYGGKVWLMWGADAVPAGLATMAMNLRLNGAAPSADDIASYASSSGSRSTLGSSAVVLSTQPSIVMGPNTLTIVEAGGTDLTGWRVYGLLIQWAYA
jgi:hypothetical protein